MMLDILATDNMVSYNVKVARIMGLHSAIYINELINISAKAIKKSKLIAGKYFLLDRKYITERTTIEEKEQLAIDYKLVQNNIINKPEDSTDAIFINVDKLAEMISSDNEKYLNSLSKRTQVHTTSLPGMKETLKQKKAKELKTFITTDDDKLRVAFEGWIDSVQNNPKSTGLTSVKVRLFQKDVREFANGDLNLALKIIEMSTKGSYTDAQWAINNFNAHPPVGYRKRFESGTDSGVGRQQDLDSGEW